MDVLQSRPDVVNIIENIARIQGLKQHKIVDVQTNEKGEGFVGEILMVKVKDDQVDKELNLVIKLAFEENLVRDVVPVRLSFENEVHFYTQIYKTFFNFAQTAGISKPLVPQCYETSLVDKRELLVLDNLKSQGFECFDKTLLLDHDHVKLVFETYGRYHAYSFAYKDQHPEEFQELASKTHDVFRSTMKNPTFVDWLNGTVDLAKSLLVPGKDDNILSRFEKYNPKNILHTLFDAGRINCDHAALVQGDCWSNNMLFKYENTNRKKPVDIRLIDWQLAKLGSPVCDLSYFLYSGASREILDKLDYYLKIYHETLSSVIKELGSDPEKLFPFNVLKQHWKTHAKYGIILSFIVIKMKITSKEDTIALKDFKESDFDTSESNRFLEQPYNKDLYNIRMRDLLEHAAEVDAL